MNLCVHEHGHHRQTTFSAHEIKWFNRMFLESRCLSYQNIGRVKNSLFCMLNTDSFIFWGVFYILRSLLYFDESLIFWGVSYILSKREGKTRGKILNLSCAFMWYGIYVAKWYETARWIKSLPPVLERQRAPISDISPIQPVYRVC